MDYKAPAAKADRLERKAARKQARADRKEAKGKSGKAAKIRAKAAVKSAKANKKRTKQAVKGEKQAARQEKRLARTKKRQAAKSKIKAAVKKGAKAAGKKAVSAAKKAVKNSPAGKAVAGAKKKVKGTVRKAKNTVKKAKKVATAVAGAAKSAMEMNHKGAAKFDRVVLGGNKDDKSKTNPGKRDYEPKGTSMHHKGASQETPAEKKKALLKDNPVDNRSKDAMNKGDAPMMNRMYKSGGLYKGPSMGKIKYGHFEKIVPAKGQGKPGMSMMQNQLSKHFKGPGKYHK
jgi:hypothetical protein